MPPWLRPAAVKDIVMEHWKQFGRNVYSRYDYEGVKSEEAEAMMKHLGEVITSSKKGRCHGCGFIGAALG